MIKAPIRAFFDIETFPMLAYVWVFHEAEVLRIVEPVTIASFAVQYNDGPIETYIRPDFPLYKRQPKSDEAVVKKLWEMMSKADIIIGHNSDNFDIKHANTRFIKYQLEPPRPYKTADTLKIARAAAKFPSNKLDNLARYLDIGHKIKHTGKDLWFDCMAGDAAAWKMMRDYNEHDVFLLKKVHDRLLPYAKTYPNLNLVDGTPRRCPRCFSEIFQPDGFRYNKTQRVHRYQCLKCLSHFMGEREKLDNRVVFG